MACDGLTHCTALHGLETDMSPSAPRHSKDYSSAYIVLNTDDEQLKGYGMTFTIGRGNDIVCEAIRQVAKKLVGKPTEELFADMGQTWSWITAGEGVRPPATQSNACVADRQMGTDPQMRW